MAVEVVDQQLREGRLGQARPAGGGEEEGDRGGGRGCAVVKTYNPGVGRTLGAPCSFFQKPLEEGCSPHPPREGSATGKQGGKKLTTKMKEKHSKKNAGELFFKCKLVEADSQKKTHPKKACTLHYFSQNF